jgi:hypothetical protein
MMIGDKAGNEIAAHVLRQVKGHHTEMTRTVDSATGHLREGARMETPTYLATKAKPPLGGGTIGLPETTGERAAGEMSAEIETDGRAAEADRR